MNRARELLNLLESRRDVAEQELYANLKDKEWVTNALNKMGKKWLFSGDVNAFDYGGTWWKWNGNYVEVVKIGGLEDSPSENEMQITTGLYSVADLMKDSHGVVSFVDATLGGNEKKPENQISNIVYGMVSYRGGDHDIYKIEKDTEDYPDEDKFWSYMKRKYGIKK